MVSKLRNKLATSLGKVALATLKITEREGTALPGKVALKVQPNILNKLSDSCNKIVLITGTNGKTTTNNLINSILNGKYKNIASNLKGANMIQGVISSFIINPKKSYDWGIFEVDEGSFEEVVKQINPDYVILTNFFRDQLDRYGEIENTIKMVYNSLKGKDFTLILNTDDPSTIQFNELSNKKENPSNNVDYIYYGVSDNTFSDEENSIAEGIFCLRCGSRLDYDYVKYGNIGKYVCNNCGAKRKEPNYLISNIQINKDSYDFTVESRANDIGATNSENRNKNNENIKDNNNDNDGRDSTKINFGYMGIYNAYNCIGAIAFASEIGIPIEFIKERIESFEYKLGRMETFDFKDKKVTLVLTKNPVGLSEVLNSISYDNRSKTIMFMLNDHGADGKDISWIWDASLEKINEIDNIKNFYATGIRAEESALRIKYAGLPLDKIKIIPSKSKNVNDIIPAIEKILKEDVEVVYVLGTYTATPEIRKALIKKH